jgi:hypothetical protein
MSNHKSAMGKSINMEKLAMANEKVVAVGNRKVNARGDELDSRGAVVKAKSQIMKEYYELPQTKPTDFNSTVVAERERSRKQREAEKSKK